MMREVNAATERLRRWSGRAPTGACEGDASEDQKGAEGKRQTCGLVERTRVKRGVDLGEPTDHAAEVGPRGIEPRTRGLKVRCSAD